MEDMESRFLEARFRCSVRRRSRALEDFLAVGTF